MNLSKSEREELRMMFGGFCAYCGVLLNGKWHADHVEAVERIGFFKRGKWVKTGEMLCAHNDCKGNLFPACVRCNILKAAANVEGFRSSLSYMAHSIPRIKTYSHVHHLMRFEKLHIDKTPVVFWFEKFLENNAKEQPGDDEDDYDWASPTDMEAQ